MSHNMRKKARVCYKEPEEPSFDEYMFCTSCGDYVYEYCSIHGPLLVIPDDEVPSPTTGYPSFVPRAALSIPRVFLHLAPSIIPDAGIGVFSTLTLPGGVRFGPYRGLKTDAATSAYCWQIFDRDHKPSHVLDARDATRANWMRYVNCARHRGEQGLVAFQYQGELYYRTTRVIPRFTELLVFYGSEFASELNIDLRRYHSPIQYTETFVKCADDTTTQMAEAPTVNNNESQNLKTEEITPKLNETQDQYPIDPSESNSLITDLQESLEENETAGYESRDQQFSNENIDSNEPQNYHSNQTLDENTVYVPQATRTVKNNKIHKNVCPICNVKFTSKSDLINHDIKAHNSNIEYKACTICDYKTTKNYSLKEHIERHGDFKPLSELETAPTLQKPANNHTAAKDSNVTSESEQSLKSNIEKPHTCTICGNKYQRSDSLKKHIRRVHNVNLESEQSLKSNIEKPHTCTICGNKYQRSDSLKKHIRRVHNVNLESEQSLKSNIEKPHTCTICGNKFQRSDTLKKHIRRVHNFNLESLKSNIGKPHTCTICGNKLQTSDSLKEHIRRIHNQERAHICTICKRGFHTNYELKLHMEYHSQGKPHVCIVCNMRFCESRGLNIHIFRVHTTLSQNS